MQMDLFGVKRAKSLRRVPLNCGIARKLGTGRLHVGSLVVMVGVVALGSLFTVTPMNRKRRIRYGV